MRQPYAAPEMATLAAAGAPIASRGATAAAAYFAPRPQMPSYASYGEMRRLRTTVQKKFMRQVARTCTSRDHATSHLMFLALLDEEI